MFWKKKKNNKIVFWCDLKGLPDIVPIRESKHFIPEWFKKAPAFPLGSNELSDMPTVKRCPGFIDFFKMGYVLPAWCDFHLEISENVQRNREQVKVETPQNAFPFDLHHLKQFADYLPEHAKNQIKLIFKPSNPWRVKTPKGISMLQLPMSYHYNPDFYALTGIRNSYIYHEFNPQLIFSKSGKFFIKRGTPLAMYIPIITKQFDVIIRERIYEDFDSSERQKYGVGSSFQSGFRHMEKKIYDDERR